MILSRESRFELATLQIAGNHRLGGGVSDVSALENCGYSEFAEYWRDGLSKVWTVSNFAHLLATHLTTPEGFAFEVRTGLRFERKIEKTIALATGEPWLRGDIISDAYAAALWLFRRQIYRELIPQSLLALLEDQTNNAIAVGAAPVEPQPGSETPASPTPRGDYVPRLKTFILGKRPENKGWEAKDFAKEFRLAAKRAADNKKPWSVTVPDQRAVTKAAQKILDDLDANNGS